MITSGYAKADETYRRRPRGGHHVEPTDEGIEPEPDEVLDLDAPIPRAEAIALLSAIVVDPAQKVIDDLAAGHRALRDEVVFAALRAAGVPLMRTGNPDTSVWVGMISRILRQNRSMRLRKRVYPSDRFAEQQKMFASFAAFQRFGCAGDTVFDVWHDRDGQRVTLATFKEEVDRLTEALENLRRRIASLTSSAAEVVFVGLEVAPQDNGQAFALRSHLIVKRQGVVDTAALGAAIAQKLGHDLTLIEAPSLAEIESLVFRSGDMLALSECEPSVIPHCAALIETCKLQRPCGAFRTWRSSEVGTSSVPMLVRVQGGPIALLVQKAEEKEVPVEDTKEDCEVEVVEDEEEAESEGEGDPEPETAAPPRKPKRNIKCGLSVGLLGGSFFYEPIVRIRDYDPKSKDPADQKRLAECLGSPLVPEFERRMGLHAKRARDLNRYLAGIAADLVGLTPEDAMEAVRVILAAMLETEDASALSKESLNPSVPLGFMSPLFDHRYGPAPQLRRSEFFIPASRDLQAGNN